MSYDEDVPRGQSYHNSHQGDGSRSDGNWQQVDRRSGRGGGRGDY
jgi:hypothetical protein